MVNLWTHMGAPSPESNYKYIVYVITLFNGGLIMNDEYKAQTGPVRVSGYAIKLRRVINGMLRPLVKEGKVDSKTLNESITHVNQAIYKVLAEKYNIPKQAVTNIVLVFTLEDSKVVPKSIEIEVFDKDEILSENTTKEVRLELGI